MRGGGGAWGRHGGRARGVTGSGPAAERVGGARGRHATSIETGER
jgi:hypothetical protein